MFPLLVAVMVCLAAALPAWACTLPIFRYGLEQWHPDVYVVTIFTKGEADEATQGVVDWLEEAADRDEGPANLRVQLVDIDRLDEADDPDQDLGELWARVGEDAQPPLMVVQYPNPGGFLLPVVQPARVFDTVWQGTPSIEAAGSIVDSPVRQEIARRVLDGDSIVWILIEGGDEEADDEAAEQLKTWIDDASKKIPLPEIDERDIEKYMSGYGPEMRVAMSMIRVSREDAAEAATLGMLLEQEGGLREADTPIAVPVFGRGRMLGGFTGEFFTQEMIDTASEFLIGSVDSCEIKDQNPGTDLLTVAPWSAVMQDGAAPGDVMPAMTGLPTMTPEEIEEATVVGPDATSTQNVVNPSLYLPIAWTVAAVEVAPPEAAPDAEPVTANPRVREVPDTANDNLKRLTAPRTGETVPVSTTSTTPPTTGAPVAGESGTFAGVGLMWLGLLLVGALAIIIALSVYVVRNGAAEAV